MAPEAGGVFPEIGVEVRVTDSGGGAPCAQPMQLPDNLRDLCEPASRPRHPGTGRRRSRDSARVREPPGAAPALPTTRLELWA